MFSVNDPKRKTLAKELEEEENVLKQCIEKLKSIEASRIALVSNLREALNEQVVDCTHSKLLFIDLASIYSLNFFAQESELENVRTQMQVES